MKRLLMIVLSFALASVCASAQYRNDVAVDSLDGIMVKKGGALMLDGMKIAKEGAQLHIPEYYDRWRKANAGYKTGLGLTIAGSYLTVQALASYAFFRTKHEPLLLDPVAAKCFSGITCIHSACLAIPCLIAGIPTLCVYNSRLKELARDYNEGHRNQDVSLNFGSQNNGIGFALNF